MAKTSKKQLQIESQAQALCKDWPVGECRGLHVKAHKSMSSVWWAAQALGLLTTDNKIDEGGYYRFCRTSADT